MKAEKLKNKFIEEHGTKEVHPLHHLILEESCETALRASEVLDDVTLNTVVSVGFLTCLTGLREIVEEGLRDYDRVRIVYRGETFIFETVQDPAFQHKGFNFFRNQN